MKVKITRNLTTCEVEIIKLVFDVLNTANSVYEIDDELYVALVRLKAIKDVVKIFDYRISQQTDKHGGRYSCFRLIKQKRLVAHVFLD